MRYMTSARITEQDVISKIRKKKVAKIEHVVEELKCSTWTFFTKLKGHKYYTSYNFNRQYITLENAAEFDTNGIWEYQGIRFSKWGNVEETICHIVNKSPAGLSAGDIAKLLQIRTHNQLLKCRKRDVLFRRRYGRSQIYYSIEEEKQIDQMGEREKMFGNAIRSVTPPPLSCKKTVTVLLSIINHHEKRSKEIASILASEGKKISERSVKWVLDKYDIEKRGSP